MNCRLCHSCWSYWKKYGGLKVASRLADSESEMIKKKTAVTAADTATAVSRAAVIPVVAAATTVAAVAATAVVANSAVGNDLETCTDVNSISNDLSNRSPHKCSIANCDKEFKVKAHLARHYAQAHGIAIRSGSPRPIMKTRTAFYLQTTGATKLSRRLCRQIIRSKKAARQPSYAINLQAVKQECKFNIIIIIIIIKINININAIFGSGKLRFNILINIYLLFFLRMHIHQIQLLLLAKQRLIFVSYSSTKRRIAAV